MMFYRFDRWGNQLGVVGDLLTANHKDELGGEDTLTLVLPDSTIDKGDRIVWRDRFGDWHEHTACELTTSHSDGVVENTVLCENSISELLLTYIEDKRPTNTTSASAMSTALNGTRWGYYSEVTGNNSTTFYQISSRAAIADIADVWGGEVETKIDVEADHVSKRTVRLLNRRGSDSGIKRFSYDKDMTAIERKITSADVVTAMYGYGKGLETTDEDGNATGGYSRKLTFGEINGGLDYVTDEDAREAWGVIDANGDKAHAFGSVTFDDCEDMYELLDLTKAALEEQKQPTITYMATVIDLADYGYQFEDVRTGDTVVIIDKVLGERLSGRVLCVERDLFNEDATVITLGNIARSINDVIAEVVKDTANIKSRTGEWDGAAGLSTAYLDRVIKGLNTELNSSGGYVYMEQGEGITTYDKAENPTKAIQIVGAGFRIANSKTSDGEWNWRTFGTGDGFTADCLTTGTITGGSNYWNLETGELFFKQGRIQSTDGKNYWDLGTGELSFESLNSVTVGGEQLVQKSGAVTDIDVEYAQNQSDTTAPTSGWQTAAPSWKSGYYIWQRTKTIMGDGKEYYSTPTCISGRDGNSISIKGTKDSIEELPTDADEGDCWIVGGDLYVFSGGSWNDVGQIVGEKGADGTRGSVVWTTSAEPTSENSEWYWKKSDLSTVAAGVSDVSAGDMVYNGSRYAVVSRTTNASAYVLYFVSLKGADGGDGIDGNDAYIHFAYSTSSDGKDNFSVKPFTGAKYLGVYADNTKADSTVYTDYVWSLIKGEDGENGEDGLGINAVVEQYGKSSSKTTAPTSWSETQPEWEKGYYIWTRSKITWSDGTITYTDPVCATAINNANETAKGVEDDLVNYYTITEIGSLLEKKQDTIDLSVYTKRESYGKCTTAASTTTKTVTCSGFTLFEGATISVKFTYANTASTPKLNVNSTGAKLIYVGTAAMTSTDYWAAGDLVTFVYDGTNWVKATSSTYSLLKSSLNMASDSLRLSVTNGALGSKASIVLSANGTTVSTNTIDMSGVRNAFKNDATSITISAGTITFNSGTFVVNSTYFSVSSTGVIKSTSGTIGGFTIKTSSLYYGSKTSLTSNSSGVYIGNNGIATGSGSSHVIISGGEVYGGCNTSSKDGYINFNNYWDSSKTYATRIGGNGGIFLLSPRIGVADYVQSGNITADMGVSATITYVGKPLTWTTYWVGYDGSSFHISTSSAPSGMAWFRFSCVTGCTYYDLITTKGLVTGW